MGADFDEKICSQISPADPSLVDEKAFDVTCSADQTEASCSFEPSVKQSLLSDDLSKQIACLSRNVLVVISLLKLVQEVLGELVHTVEASHPPKQPSHCDIEDLLPVPDTCENGVVTRVKEQSIEVGPQVFQVVQEKQIGVETALADHVFFRGDATITNSRPFNSSEKSSIPPRKVVKSTSNAAPSERVNVDVRSSDSTCQKGNVDMSIKSIDGVSFQLRPDDFTVSVGVANFKFQALLDTGAAVSAVSAHIWREYVIDIHPNLNPLARFIVTTVDGCELVTLGALVVF